MSALDMRAAALKIAAFPFRVFPLPAGRKAARLPKWNVLATTDKKQVEAWWASGSTSNIAIATGRGLLVLDEDPRHGSQRSIQQLQESHGALPETRTARTPSGGQHHYFRVPSDREVPNSTSKLGAGLDIRGDGGYVVAPPSVLAAVEKQTAGAYTWENKAPIADAPEWLIALATKKRQTETSANGVTTVALSSISGEQLEDLQSALAHPALLEAASTYQGWADVGLALLSLGEKGRRLWLEFSAHAPNNNPKETAAEWWQKNQATSPKQDFLHLYKLAGSLGWRNPRGGAAGLAKPADFPTADPTAATTTKPSRFKPIPVDAFTSGPEPEWIIDGVVPRSELMVVYGEPGCGKSFFVADFAASIARGVKWRNRDVVQGRVAYICAESASGFRQRWRAYASVNGITLADMNESLFMIVEAPNLLQANDIGELILQLQAIGPFAFIAIDTLARATPGGNENSGEDMGLALDHCKAIHRATGALVCLVHHSGKDQARGARGWSGIRGAADTEIEVTRVRGNIRQAAVSKQRDGEDGLKFEFTLDVAAAGLDVKGHTLTSLVVRAVESAARSGIVAPMKPPKSPNQRAVWEVLDEAQREMQAQELITAAVGRLVYDKTKLRDRRRNVITRAIDQMRADGVLVESSGLYSLCGSVEFTAAEPQSKLDSIRAELIGDIS
jgi:hypothetical protein